MKRLLAGILVLTLALGMGMRPTLAEEADAAATSTPEPMPADAGEASVPIADADDAAQVVRLTVETVPADASGEATVALLIENGNGADSLQCNLNYNASAMTVVSVEPGVTFPAEYCITNVNEPGRVRLATACALGINDDSGTVILLRVKLTGDIGGAITISDAIVTHVGAEYVQTEEYVEIVDGGVSVNGTLPPSVVTPWIPKTPEPAATPTPAPTEAPAPAVLTTPAPLDTPAPTAAPEKAPAMLPYVIIGVLAVLLAAGIVILLVGSGNKKRKRRGKKGKRKASAKRRG